MHSEKLIYLTVTHLGISYFVGVLSQQISAPTLSHWMAITHIYGI